MSTIRYLIKTKSKFNTSVNISIGANSLQEAENKAKLLEYYKPFQDLVVVKVIPYLVTGK